MAELDDDFRAARKVISIPTRPAAPNCRCSKPSKAGVLLEVMKDLLYQAYVRRGRLQQAMMMRRYFAEESTDKVTPLPAARQ